MVLRVAAGQIVVFQTFWMVLWWKVETRKIHECASDMLTAGFLDFLPKVCSANEALQTYYVLYQGYKPGTPIPMVDVRKWDEQVRANPKIEFCSWRGYPVRAKLVVTHTHTYSHTHIRTHMHTHILTYPYAHTHIHTYTHTHPHT